MKRSVFLLGCLMIFGGFMLYQFGFSSELHQSTLLSRWLTGLVEPTIQYGLSFEVIALTLQFSGGFLTLLGLVICFAGVATSKIIRIADRPAENLREVPARIVASCRFCGAGFKERPSFCPVCSKSQV